MIGKKLVLAVSLVLMLNVFVAVASAFPQMPLLEKRVFIHYFSAKPLGPKPPRDEHSSHFALLGKGVKWKQTPVTYYIDPDNSQGLPATFIASAIFASAEEWDSHTGTELFGGSYTTIHDGSWDGEVPDGKNELVFDNYPQQGVIAVTVIWGIFSGPVGQRMIVEFDIMFNTDFVWGDATVLGGAVMDLQNIATHELGHGAGLGDIYYCSLETMYGYSNYGETIKRDLYTGDIGGIQTLYGA